MDYVHTFITFFLKGHIKLTQVDPQTSLQLILSLAKTTLHHYIQNLMPSQQNMN